MPHRLSRLASLVAGLAIVAGAGVAPGTALGAARGGPVVGGDTWIVTLRTPDRSALPTRRGGLRPQATAIARDRAARTTRTIDALETGLGFRATQRYTYALSGFAARLSAAQLAALREDPRVTGIRRARPVELAGQTVPAGIGRVGAQPGTAPAASDDVTVAIVDTGVGRWVDGAWRHAGELNVVAGVNAYNPPGGACDGTLSAPATYADTNGHGTHVAGTIGAMDNDTGVVGVAPGVKLVSVRVFQGTDGSDATVICGLDWIAAWNAGHPSESDDIDAVNMSLRGFTEADPNPGCDHLGDPGGIDAEEAAVCTVVEVARATVLVAAGNETDLVENYTPSRYASVITVSAITDFDGLPGGLAPQPGWCAPPRGTETDDTFSLYSNRGPEVDIAAPGTCVRSTSRDSADGVTVMSGTSMATPHVTGAVARYLGLHPDASPAEVRTRLIASAATDWDAVTDPDSQPDRLVDVAALVAADPDIALGAVPQEVSVPDGTTERVVKLRLQRAGGYAGPVELSVAGGLPAGVADITFGNGGTIAAGQDLDSLRTQMTITFDADPADATRTLAIHASGDGGLVADLQILIRFDGTPPVVGSPWPRITFRTGTWMNSAPVRLSWSASDGQGTLRSQELQRSRRSGAFSTYSRPGVSVTSTDASMERWVDTAWRIRATDLVGNSAVSTPLATRMAPIQAEKAEASTGWALRPRASASGGEVLRTTAAWRTVTFDLTGRGVALVAPQGPGKGKVRIRLDGVVVATVDLARKVASPRKMVWVSDALTVGPHTLKVTALGGTVDLDAFLVLK